MKCAIRELQHLNSGIALQTVCELLKLPIALPLNSQPKRRKPIQIVQISRAEMN
jgi:hypothetical protein